MLSTLYLGYEASIIFFKLASSAIKKNEGKNKMNKAIFFEVVI
jgi:hypothetical protein